MACCFKVPLHGKHPWHSSFQPRLWFTINAACTYVSSVMEKCQRAEFV